MKIDKKQVNMTKNRVSKKKKVIIFGTNITIFNRIVDRNKINKKKLLHFRSDWGIIEKEY